MLDESARVLSCGECGAVLDPIEWIAEGSRRRIGSVAKENAKAKVYDLIEALRKVGGTITFRPSGVELKRLDDGRRVTTNGADVWNLEYQLAMMIRPARPVAVDSRQAPALAAVPDSELPS